MLSLLENKVNITDISKIIGVSRATIYEWMKRNNLPVSGKKIEGFTS